jgi:HAE1 family hydrophobic/amphiphilic exporter-1
MASSVAQPLERQLAQIPGITQMTSTSSLGSASITIQFDLNRLIDAAANDVQAAINAAGGQLPKNLPSPPTYRKVNPADSPIMILSATSETLPLTTVSDRTDAQLAQQISQISGVAQVFVGGQQKPSVRIQIDPAKLVAKGLSLEDVRSQIAIATTDSPKGNIDGTRRAYTVYANDQLLEATQWQDVIVAYRNGAPLRIRDIGEAVSGPEDMKTAAWADGKRGVFLVIFKQPGANVIETVNRIKEKLPRLIAAIPPAISIKIISDRTITIRAAVDDVQITLMITIVLVVMVIFIFLRSFWATIIPSITVPLALLGACSLMWVFGYSLDNLSLMALTIAVGFVVDDAIVMLENITRYVERGENPVTAAYKGAAEIGFTIVSISISLVAVLIPLLLMGGIIGRLFREFAATLSMAIFVSLVVSLTLTPMMASRFLRSDHEARSGRFYQWSERLFERLLGAYEHGLDLALRHSLITLCIFFATVALSTLLFILIPKGFFPQQDNGFLTAVSEMPQDISFAEMKRRQEELNAIVQADPAVDSIAMFIGGGGTGLNSGRMYVTLKPIGERDANAQQIIARLRPKLAKVEGGRLYMQASQDVRLGGRATRTQFEFTVQDANLSELNAWAPRILTEMKSLAELRDVATDQQTEGTTVQLTINRDTAARYGIQPQLIDDTLYDAFGQRQVAQYFTQTNSYHVVLEITPALQGKLDTLDKLYIKSPLTGDEVPLSVICSWTDEPVRPLAIAHQSQFPAVTISFNLAGGVALGQATAAVMHAVSEIGAPPTLSMSFQGTAQAFQQSLGTVPMLILAALVVVYLVLGVLYESYIHPLTILSTLPSAGVGAIAILMIFGFDFSLIALIGVILLIGIVKKNGIMMVDFAIAAEREQHLTPEQSIRQAALLRFRPIMMTTMAALLGGVPLMLGTGAGAEIRQPLGYAMVGGLVVSQALTLFTTPVVYLYLDRFSNMLSRWMEKTPETEVESEEQKVAAE